MKHLLKLATAITLLLTCIFVISCDKKDDDNTEPSTKGSFTMMIDNTAIDTSNTRVNMVKDTIRYLTTEGDTFSVDHLKYFISDVTLVKSDGSGEYKIPVSYNLIKLDDGHPSYRTMITMSNIPTGNYNKIKFGVGVPDPCNTVTACTDGDLDPFSGDPEKMIWDWSNGSGYKFLRFQGDYKGNGSTGSPNGSFSYHVGGNSQYRQYELATLDLIKIRSDKNTMVHIVAMIEQVFEGSVTIDMEATPDQGTAGAGNLADNYGSGMFMIHHVNDPM